MKYDVMWTLGEFIECERLTIKAETADQAVQKAIKKMKRELLPRTFASVKISHVGPA